MITTATDRFKSAKQTHSLLEKLNENVEFYEHYLLNNTKNPIIKEFIKDFIDNKDYNGSYYYHIAIFYAYEFDKIELNKPVPESLNIDLNGN